MSDKILKEYDYNLDVILDSQHEEKVQYQEPSLYQIILINDDYTPMDFVVYLIELFFLVDRDKAVSIMLDVHKNGRGVCGVFPRDIAETKVEQINIYSRKNNYPLLCIMEQAN